MPFVSPHSALFGKQFQGQSCSPLISLGGVHLFILRTPQLSLSLEVERYRSGKKKEKRAKTLQKGGGSCSKSHGMAGEAGGKAGVRPGQLQTQGAQRTSVPPRPASSPPVRMHGDGRGGGHEEFPSPPGRSWLPATTRGGLGQQARASNPNLAKGRKVELRTGMQLFAALPGMQEQSQVAGIGAGATGGGAHRGRSLTQTVRGTLLGKVAAPLPMGNVFAARCVRDARPHLRQGRSPKKSPSLGQTDDVCQAEPLQGDRGTADTAATLLGMWCGIS